MIDTRIRPGLVALTDAELAEADAVADANYDYARTINARPKYGAPNYSAAARFITRAGFRAEAAACKHAGWFWPGTIGPDWSGDLRPGVQVRSTRWPHGRLLLHPADDDTHTFVLVTGEAPTYCVRGAILAAEGKRPQWWRTDIRHPAYLVPQAALGPWPG